MKKRNNILMAGLVVASVMIAGISVNASSDVIGDTVDTVKERFGGHRDGSRQGETRDYSTAVEEGILSQAEADAIAAYREANQVDRQALKDELDGLTKEEARAYMEDNGFDRQDSLADLVEEGLLTEEQAEALEALRPEVDGERRGNKSTRSGNRQGNGFEQAIEEGILTEDDLEAIQAFQEANRPDKEALQAELEGLTREEARAYMTENYPKADLVEEGLLSQEQVDALEALRDTLESERPVKSEGMERGRDGGRGMRSETTEDTSL